MHWQGKISALTGKGLILTIPLQDPLTNSKSMTLYILRDIPPSTWDSE